MALPKHVVITNEKRRTARFSFVVPLGGSYSVAPPPATAVAGLAAQDLTGAGGGVNALAPLAQSAPAFEDFDEVKPKDTDYIYPLFRALSAVLIAGYWIDFSKPGVLEAATPLLEGQTVFKNHNFYDVEKWLGAVNKSVWDAAGASTGGVPGINAELKIDWKVNPLVARGLLMTPPAIHSVSVTVESEFEYSHPDIVQESKWKFYDLLGEEVGGQIVRFIVTKILAFWEISLVFRGADSLANHDGVAETARESFAAPPPRAPLPEPAAPAPVPADTTPTATTEETHTVKLTPEQKQKLGLTAHDGEDVEDGVVLSALAGLADRAAAGDALVDAARTECLRVATLAEAGTDGALPPAIADVIRSAGTAQLEGLTKLYTEKAAAKFTKTCQQCGSTNVAERSSVEALSPEATARPKPRSRNTADLLH